MDDFDPWVASAVVIILAILVCVLAVRIEELTRENRLLKEQLSDRVGVKSVRHALVSQIY